MEDSHWAWQPRWLVLVMLLVLFHDIPLILGEDTVPQPTPALLEELQLIKEEESVSIASRYEQPISQAPSNVYVITDEDIRQSGATDLPTVLRRIPGIEVMQMSGADFNVSVRGNNQTSANKLLVLVDGRSIYIDVQANVYWKAIPVTLPEIKRIEVLKGPASAVYGFNAFDGVINIITKSPAEMKGTTLQFGGGSYGTISSAAIQAGTVDKFGYRLSAGHDQNQQWRNSSALAFRSDKFNAQTEYALSGDSKVTISGGIVNVNRFDGPVVDVFQLSNPFTDSYANVAYERSDFFLRGWWREWNASTDLITAPQLANNIRLTDQNGNSNSVPFIGNTYNVEAQHRLEFGNANRLNFGMNYRLNTLSSTAITGFSKEHRFGLYLQDEWKVTHSLTAAAGVRYDLDTFIHATISPRFSLLYTPVPDHTFRMGISVAYRPPTLFETHDDVLTVLTLPLPPPFNTTTVSNRGSTNLNPEEIVSYNLGYQGWYLRHRLRVRADLFFNHISNLIFAIPTSPTTSTYTNGGVADIYGGEAGAEILVTRWLSGFANFSYEEIGQTLTGAAQRGAPRFKANAGLRGDWENGLNGEVGFFHVGAATYPVPAAFSTFATPGVPPPNPRVGSYNLLNIRAAYKFWKQKAVAGHLRDAEVAVTAFNALNDRHKENPIGDSIGSRVMGWLTVRF
jgi:outer membrane receptor for ferrienterochelin and colicin